ncbi:MAG: penicillin-binding protein 2 [Hyphomicrobiales bacterium]|nr:penicillin-binding protein 2 [Hyphomicrobiales bacterium]
MRPERSTGRVMAVSVAFLGVFALIDARLLQLGLRKEPPPTFKSSIEDTLAKPRPDILDREGRVLATDVMSWSIFAEPKRLVDKDEAVDQLATALPGVDSAALRRKFDGKKGFVWVARKVTEKERAEVFHLGLPGIGFVREPKRVYPNGPIGAHVIGAVNTDNVGIAGLEEYIDRQGLATLRDSGIKIRQADLKPLVTSLDLRATQALRDELEWGMRTFSPKAAGGAIVDVNTGEVLAMASLPDFDPNVPADALKKDNIDRIAVGTYEMGSTFKAMTLAMGLESGKFTLRSMVDARHSLRYGRFTIHDFEAQHRMLSYPEVFTFSSNIGAAHIALAAGVDAHQAFLRKMGQLTRLRTELPESASPIVPKHWSDLNTITIAFGQGINVTPLQALMAVCSIVNGGRIMPPTFLKVADPATRTGTRVISEATSEDMRYLMRMNAVKGSARKANIPGYFVGGKTGTADKIVHGHYDHSKVFTTFMAAVPVDKPKYLFFVMYDQPQALKKDGGFHTSAYNSGRVAGRLIRRVLPLLGEPPLDAAPADPFPRIAASGYPLDPLALALTK